jgi:hypothetical protein
VILPEQKLSDHLQALKKIAEPLTIQILLDRVEDRGVLLLIILLNLPFCLPIPLPGLSIPFGITLMLLSFRLGTGFPKKFPSSIGNREIPPKLLHTLLDKSLWLSEKAETWVRPRLLFLFHHSALYRLHAFMIFILALLLALPLPIPSTNFAPAAAILLLAMGLIERDGIILLLGYLAALLGIAYFGFLLDLILSFGEKALHWVTG